MSTVHTYIDSESHSENSYNESTLSDYENLLYSQVYHDGEHISEVKEYHGLQFEKISCSKDDSSMKTLDIPKFNLEKRKSLLKNIDATNMEDVMSIMFNTPKSKAPLEKGDGNIKDVLNKEPVAPFSPIEGNKDGNLDFEHVIITDSDENCKDVTEIEDSSESVISLSFSNLKNSYYPCRISYERDVPYASVSQIDAQLNSSVLGNSKTDLFFSTADVLSSMPDNGWDICENDLHGTPSFRRSRFYDIRCKNCNEIGHIMRNCSRRNRNNICVLCGATGHNKSTCLSRVCFSCREPGHGSDVCWSKGISRKHKCARCGGCGHKLEFCVGWIRAFHKTLEVREDYSPKSFTPNTNARLFCFNCGAKGHLGHKCSRPSTRPSFIPSSPFITNFKKFNESSNCTFQGSSRDGKMDKRVNITPKGSKRDFAHINMNCQSDYSNVSPKLINGSDGVEALGVKMQDNIMKSPYLQDVIHSTLSAALVKPRTSAFRKHVRKVVLQLERVKRKSIRRKMNARKNHKKAQVSHKENDCPTSDIPLGKKQANLSQISNMNDITNNDSSISPPDSNGKGRRKSNKICEEAPILSKRPRYKNNIASDLLSSNLAETVDN